MALETAEIPAEELSEIKKLLRTINEKIDGTDPNVCKEDLRKCLVALVTFFGEANPKLFSPKRTGWTKAMDFFKTLAVLGADFLLPWKRKYLEAKFEEFSYLFEAIKRYSNADENGE